VVVLLRYRNQNFKNTYKWHLFWQWCSGFKKRRLFINGRNNQIQNFKYWLKGAKAGTTEIFIDNLPGFPNGISIRENGTYWLGFTTKRNDALDKIHPKIGMKKLVYSLPNFLQPKADKFGMVINISANGSIIDTFFDTKGKTLFEAGSVKEHNGYLYIGGDVIPYIGKYKM